ncbi:MAG: hypothetical protein LBP53_04435 [Candidatus Peribacteria bacterium]|nr:hypothetical protein [Candidatus Peribacteria bacterium]
MDGIYGKNTQAAARIIQGGEAKTEQERKRKRGHYHHKKLAVEHQNRRQDYLNRLPNSTVKSMKETSVLDIGRNETLTTFLQQKGETNPITYEQKVQRHKEGVIKAILPKLQGLLTEGQLSSLLDEQGNVKPTARKQLLERNIDKQYFGKIMKELYHPDYEHIQQHIREKIREATKERAKNLKAINDVLQYIKQYLNITTEGENLNF